MSENCGVCKWFESDQGRCELSPGLSVNWHDECQQDPVRFQSKDGKPTGRIWGQCDGGHQGSFHVVHHGETVRGQKTIRTQKGVVSFKSKKGAKGAKGNAKKK